jgi:hypothetical protein
MNLTSQSCNNLSKKFRTSASKIQFTFFRITTIQLFVDLVEDRHYGLMNDLVLQGCYAQGALPPIGFRDIGFFGRLRSIRRSMDSAMQVCQLLIQARLKPSSPVAASRFRGY